MHPWTLSLLITQPLKPRTKKILLRNRYLYVYRMCYVINGTMYRLDFCRPAQVKKKCISKVNSMCLLPFIFSTPSSLSLFYFFNKSIRGWLFFLHRRQFNIFPQLIKFFFWFSSFSCLHFFFFQSGIFFSSFPFAEKRENNFLTSPFFKEELNDRQNKKVNQTPYFWIIFFLIEKTNQLEGEKIYLILGRYLNYHLLRKICTIFDLKIKFSSLRTQIFTEREQNLQKNKSEIHLFTI